MNQINISTWTRLLPREGQREVIDVMNKRCPTPPCYIPARVPEYDSRGISAFQPPLSTPLGLRDNTGLCPREVPAARDISTAPLLSSDIQPLSTAFHAAPRPGRLATLSYHPGAPANFQLEHRGLPTVPAAAQAREPVRDQQHAQLRGGSKLYQPHGMSHVREEAISEMNERGPSTTDMTQVRIPAYGTKGTLGVPPVLVTPWRVSNETSQHPREVPFPRSEVTDSNLVNELRCALAHGRIPQDESRTQIASLLSRVQERLGQTCFLPSNDKPDRPQVTSVLNSCDDSIMRVTSNPRRRETQLVNGDRPLAKSTGKWLAGDRARNFRDAKLLTRIRRSRRSRSSSTSSSENEQSSDSGSLATSGSGPAMRSIRDRHSPKLPPFTDKQEAWSVWLNRFNDVAQVQGWSKHRKLEELLPRLHGPAGEFVYGQLSPQVRGSFRKLTRELEFRFRKIETPSTFRMKFSHRRQKTGESVESFATDLKRFYDKAYPDRDRKTRKEDLLRKFFEGVLDESARHLVEYVKTPETIDEAVFEMVNFLDSRRRVPNVDYKRRQGRVSWKTESSGSESELEFTETRPTVARAVGRPPKAAKKETVPVNPDGKGQIIDEVSSDKEDSNPRWKSVVNRLEDRVNWLSTSFKHEMQESMKNLSSTVRKLEEHHQEPRPPMGHQPAGPPNRLSIPPRGPPRPRGGQECFKCGKLGHFARDCWTFTGQMRMSAQPGYQSQDERKGVVNRSPNYRGSNQAAGNGSNMF